ncbi:MAG: hypothetical protein ABH864_06885 [archaeon]
MKNWVKNGLIALTGVVLGCSQIREANLKTGVRRDSNYLVRVAGDGLYARVFDREGIQSVEVAGPDGAKRRLYDRNGEEIDYRLFVQASSGEDIQSGDYTLKVTDIFGGTEIVTTNSDNIERVPHSHWASP